MHRVRLIHWNAAEAEPRAELLRPAGYAVEYEALDAAGLRRLREEPPEAVVIDLSRMPSQGRDLGLTLRKYKATRHVPLVYVAGDPKKVARIQEALPDATYCAWSEMPDALARAIAAPPAEPVVPESVFAAYAVTPLPKKLGIKANSMVALAGAPEGFKETLGPLPEGVVLRREEWGGCDVTLWFVRSRRELEDGIEAMGDTARGGGLWIAWPKKTSGVASDLSQATVRGVGMASGLVDFKVCAIDATWSGLRFTQRKGG